MLRIMICDDDQRVRDDFASILRDEDDIDVVATVADGFAAVSVGKRLWPDVVVMDVRMPGMNGIEATRALKAGATNTSCGVLVVTTFDLDEYVLGAIRAGASGFLLKDEAADLLAEAVRTIAAGNAVVAPRATARLIAELTGARPLADTGTLSPREIEVVRLLALGSSNDEIAAAAHISKATVKSHVSSILTKLGLTSRIQIVVWAYEHGIAGR